MNRNKQVILTYESVYHASVRYVHLKLRFKTQHTTRYMFMPRQLKMYKNSYWFRSRRSSWDITVGYQTYRILLDITVHYQILPYITIHYHKTLPNITRYYYTLPDLTIYYQTLPYTTKSYHILPDIT